MKVNESFQQGSFSHNLTSLRATVLKCHCWAFMFLPGPSSHLLLLLPGAPALLGADIQPPLEWWPLLPVPSQNWPLAQLPVPSVPWEFSQSSSQCSFLVTFHSPTQTSSIAHPVYVWGGWTLFYKGSICTPPLHPCFQQFPWLLQLLATLHRNCFLLARKLETGYTRKKEITFLMSSHHCGRWDGGDDD